MVKKQTKCSMVENWLSKYGMIYSIKYYVVIRTYQKYEIISNKKV